MTKIQKLNEAAAILQQAKDAIERARNMLPSGNEKHQWGLGKLQLDIEDFRFRIAQKAHNIKLAPVKKAIRNSRVA